MRAIKEFFRKLFTIQCPACKNGRLTNTRVVFVGGVQVNIYECDLCKKRFV